MFQTIRIFTLVNFPSTVLRPDLHRPLWLHYIQLVSQFCRIDINPDYFCILSKVSLVNVYPGLVPTTTLNHIRKGIQRGCLDAAIPIITVTIRIIPRAVAGKEGILTCQQILLSLFELGLLRLRLLLTASGLL